MDIEELHDKFDESNIRKYLIKTFTKASQISLFVDVKELEKQMIVLQKKLENAKIVEVIDHMIKYKNWQQFDVSEIIDYDCDNYTHFIGTKDEYQKALSICKKE